MNKNLLNNYVFDLTESIERNLADYIKDKKPECLHHLRVDIKKMNAVYSFAKNVYEEKYNTANLKPLFCDAGRIREIQINIHALGLIPHPPRKLMEQLTRKENILTQQFIKRGSQYLKLIKKYRNNVCLPEKLPDNKTINKYFIKEKRKANKIIKNKERGDMHRYRRKIKKLMYAYNALPKKIQNKIELNVAEINKQQKKLGNWHDIYSTINFLSHEHFPIKTEGYVVMLKAEEKRQFNTLLRNLTNTHI